MGVTTIPKSTTLSRIKENMDIFNFMICNIEINN
ncbi:hypothetical protein CLOBY_33040 [Clostridium saccharobutylicum]|nr:hypothetical protein CLOSC_33640 [Clostridium saccharobutylicum]AQS01543.1 hypothetical protein CSACC_33720 [Clostridium saccharobutylicum]AQS11150.1 hypothetical protein CLOBY_33040 [Clostridium saccharobutylicum]AQS15526.1 hypothetical protein CLOSACC_33720 [Clostridium saccharobutylicum]MBA2906941.1 diketogulonate reductase-like aldo/keto reductase [Clostridium saccharobutylicum]